MLEPRSPDPRLEAEGLRVVVEEEIPSRVVQIGPTVDRIVAHLRTDGRVIGRADAVDLALREALTNAVVHGNRRDPEKLVRVVVAADRHDGLLLIVRDAGNGFDPASVPNPVRADGVHATHGRGVYLMRRLMKDVVFRDGGREVRMRIV